ncbi:MAG: S8 family serine peptidase [Bacteroidota bacterium]
MDPALQELILLGNQEQKVEAIIRLQKADQLPEGIEVVCRFGDIVTCRLPHQKIETIWSDEAVASMKVARYVGIDPMPEQLTEVFDHQSQDTSSISSRAEITPNGGKGVVVGIIDWRFDFTHPNFLDEEGNTRFLAIWDQTEELEDDSLKYGYGKVHHQAAINEALLEDAPFQYLGYHPAKGDPLNDGAHGTHVLDIATGNGTIGDSSAAPYADIVAVHLSAGNIEEISSLGDSVRILEAIDFIREIAGDRPTVINTSVGKTAGPHNGKTLVEQGMDNFLTEQTGRCIVQSTGNYFKHRTHASGHLREGEEKSLTWHVYRSDKTYNELEIYMPNDAAFRVALVAPNEMCITEVELGSREDIVIGGETVGRFYHRAKEPNTGFNHVDIFLYSNAPPVDWEVMVQVENTTEDEAWFHAWIERDGSCMGCQSRFEKADADPLNTTGTICNGFHTIAVGAYDMETEEMAPFSSAGPTIDGRQKPFIIAPGVHIQAAKSASYEDDQSLGELTIKSGTSMAAPHVTVTVAALFGEQSYLLPIEETFRMIKDCFMSTEIVIKGEQERLGIGILDTSNLKKLASNTDEITVIMETTNTENNNTIAEIEPIEAQEKLYLTKDHEHQAVSELVEEDQASDEIQENSKKYQVPSINTINEDIEVYQEAYLPLYDDTWEEEIHLLHTESCNCNKYLAKRRIPRFREFSYKEIVANEAVQAIPKIPNQFRLDSNAFEILAKEGNARTKYLKKGDILLSHAIGEGLLFKSILQESVNLDTDSKVIAKVRYADDISPKVNHLVLTSESGWLLPHHSILRLKKPIKPNSFQPTFLNKKFNIEDSFAILRNVEGKKLKTLAYTGNIVDKKKKAFYVKKGTEVYVKSATLKPNNQRLIIQIMDSERRTIGWTNASNIKGKFINEIIGIIRAPTLVKEQFGIKRYTVADAKAIIRSEKDLDNSEINLGIIPQ